jgi:ribosomal protein S4
MTGFKKTIYNRAKLVRNQLYPSYNRRKYHISHYKNTKTMHSAKPNIWLFKSKKLIIYSFCFQTRPGSGVAKSPGSPIAIQRHCVKMIHLLESQLSMVMYRCLFSNSIQMARQELAFEKKAEWKMN